MIGDKFKIGDLVFSSNEEYRDLGAGVITGVNEHVAIGICLDTKDYNLHDLTVNYTIKFFLGMPLLSRGKTGYHQGASELTLWTGGPFDVDSRDKIKDRMEK